MFSLAQKNRDYVHTCLIFDKVESKEQAYVLFIIYPEYYIIFDWSCGYWLIYIKVVRILFDFLQRIMYLALYN